MMLFPFRKEAYTDSLNNKDTLYFPPSKLLKVCTQYTTHIIKDNVFHFTKKLLIPVAFFPPFVVLFM